MTEHDIDRILERAQPRPDIGGPPRMLAYVALAWGAVVAVIVAWAVWGWMG